jgi:photosystem II stability/assembly factor-like uncharacterized protein
MKLRKSALFAGFIMIVSIPEIFSQPWLYTYHKEFKTTDSVLRFKEQQQAFNDYWQNRTITKGKGYKPFKRWENMMEPRLKGNEKLNSLALWSAINRSSAPPFTDSIRWNFVGPGRTPYLIETNSLSGNGRLNCVAFHPTDSNTFYVGAPSGGLWITNDDGQNWRTTTDQLDAIGISDVVVSHSNPQQIYIATGDGDAGDTYALGILKSDDGGETWNPTGLSLAETQNYYFRRLIMHPTNANTMLATSSKGIYKTSDGWQTYSLVQSGNFKDIEFKPGDPSYVYATSYNSSGLAKIYRSTNGGNSFAIISSGLTLNNKVDRIELAVTPADPKIIYALASNASNSGFYALYRSKNSGDTWTVVCDDSQQNLLGWTADGSDIGGQGWYDLSLAVSPKNSNSVIVGGVNIWKSINGGSSFSIAALWYNSAKADYVHADQHFFAYSPLSNTFFAANDGGIYNTYNEGKTWTDVSNNLQILQTYKLGTSSGTSAKIICGNQDNGTFILDNTEWYQVLGGDGMECIIDPTNEDIVYGSLQNGSLYKSSDGGLNFQSIKPSPDLTGAWVTPFLISKQNTSVLYAAYKDVYRSNDAGSTWQKISNNLSTVAFNSLVVAPSNDEYIYVANSDNIYKTINAGTSWNSIKSGLPQLAITSILVSPNDPNKIWVSFSGFTENSKVYYSANGGSNWSNFSDSLPNIPVNHLTIRYNSNQEMYAATDNGVFYRNADLQYWVDYSTGLPKVIVNELEITEPKNLLRAATYGRGIWEAELPPVIESKAAFSVDISKGCINAPYKLTFTGSPDFDSLVWIHNASEIIYQSERHDTIIISFATTGRKTIQLNHYYNDTLTSEIKYQYIEVNNSLEFNLSPDKFYACDTSVFKVYLPEGYSYTWQPLDGIDSIINNTVIIKPTFDITYTVTASHGSCETSKQFPVKFMPDAICNGLILTKGINGLFSNNCASIEEFEPVPGIGTGTNSGCVSQDGWCEGENRIDNTLWFRVIVPDSGKLRIKCYGFDSQIALYKARTCDSIYTPNYFLLAANDDISSSDYNSEISLLSELTPGDTLYLQVDGSYGGITGEFYVDIAESPSSIIVPSAEKLSNIRIFPNPAKGSFTIKLIVPGKSVVDVDLITTSGKVVQRISSAEPVNYYEETINVTDLHGLFLVRVRTKNSISYQKIILE